MRYPDNEAWRMRRGAQRGQRTSAASAARLRASSVLFLCADEESSLPPPPPNVRGGPPTLAGTEALCGCGGADPRTRPGCEKASGSDLPHMLPILLPN
jgi:hypothetical protein